MGVITFSQFGRHGRWGNQLCQYAFLACYARRYGCELQLPPWVGNHLLDAVNPPITARLPAYREVLSDGPHSHPVAPEGAEIVNHEFRGYAQHHTGWYSEEERDAVRLLFAPSGGALQQVQAATETMAPDEHTWVGLHYRLGDYGRMIFPITPLNWYQKWLDSHWEGLVRPKLFIAAEDPKIVDVFREYDPVTTADLGVSLSGKPMDGYSYLRHDLKVREPWQMDFFPDWYLLSRCNVILAPNSTFSFTAAMLAPKVQLWRSHLPTQTFRKIDPWDAWPLQRDWVEHYPDVSGIRHPMGKENPRWD